MSAACTCTGVGLRVKLAVLTGFIEHAPQCSRRGDERTPKPLFYDGYCLRHAEQDCEWCRLDAKD